MSVPFISTDFAPQENLQDALHAFGLLLSPHKWKGCAIRKELKKRLSNLVYASQREGDMSASLYFSGRSALKTLLTLLEIPKGSSVGVLGFTCEAVVLPILASGLRPVYIDISSIDFSLNKEDLQKKYTSQMSVLIIQHSFGITPIHRDNLIEFAIRNNVWIIEDLAHGFIPNNLAPPATDNTCALLSFGRSKLISSVFGAAIITPNKSLSHKLEQAQKSLAEPPNTLVMRCLLYKMLSPLIKSTYQTGLGKLMHKITRAVNLFPQEISPRERKGEYDNRYELAYPEALAHTLNLQLDRMTHVIQTMRKRGEEYQKALSLVPYSSPPLGRFPLLVKRECRANILRHFHCLGVFLGSWYSQPVSPKGVDLTKMNYAGGSCPAAEDICERVINLPLNVSYTTAQYLINKLKPLIHEGI